MPNHLKVLLFIINSHHHPVYVSRRINLGNCYSSLIIQHQQNRKFFICTVSPRLFIFRSINSSINSRSWFLYPHDVSWEQFHEPCEAATLHNSRWEEGECYGCRTRWHEMKLRDRIHTKSIIENSLYDPELDFFFCSFRLLPANVLRLPSPFWKLAFFLRTVILS